ncbi:MAG: hypothetical protein DRM99_03635 [Thermoplasmata archaeon]|nr:MAG: hypothetical protein DRM99_03635 [Thermoplasmata archaeon]
MADDGTGDKIVKIERNVLDTINGFTDGLCTIFSSAKLTTTEAFTIIFSVLLATMVSCLDVMPKEQIKKKVIDCFNLTIERFNKYEP